MPYKNEIELQELFDIIDRQVSWRGNSLKRAVLTYCGGVTPSTGELARVATAVALGKGPTQISEELGISYEKTKRLISEASQLPKCTIRPIHQTTAEEALRECRAIPGKKPWNSVLAYLTASDSDYELIDAMNEAKVYPQHRTEIKGLLKKVQEQLFLKMG